ncbi:MULTISPECIES: hypothetical protein [Paraburkholderia]|uniref:hypothetical protein n=1 Tax=Paraburkholderia TaxID=1822464 RepID=UPI001FE43091|nr:hypothetical protein [Paraburkholderia podalyriae]
MKHPDFHIGLEFLGSAGFRWRCTDVGARTILAIRLDRDDPNWYRGPPYVAEEVVFDEHDLTSCHLTEDDAIRRQAARGHFESFAQDLQTSLAHLLSDIRAHRRRPVCGSKTQVD